MTAPLPQINALRLLALLAVLLLAGCGGSNTDQPDGTSSLLDAQVVNLPDGRTVTCVTFGNNMTTGKSVSCDWEHAR